MSCPSHRRRHSQWGFFGAAISPASKAANIAFIATIKKRARTPSVNWLCVLRPQPSNCEDGEINKFARESVWLRARGGGGVEGKWRALKPINNGIKSLEKGYKFSIRGTNRQQQQRNLKWKGGEPTRPFVCGETIKRPANCAEKLIFCH